MEVTTRVHLGMRKTVILCLLVAVPACSFSIFPPVNPACDAVAPTWIATANGNTLQVRSGGSQLGSQEQIIAQAAFDANILSVREDTNGVMLIFDDGSVSYTSFNGSSFVTTPFLSPNANAWFVEKTGYDGSPIVLMAGTNPTPHGYMLFGNPNQWSQKALGSGTPTAALGWEENLAVTNSTDCNAVISIYSIGNQNVSLQYNYTAAQLGWNGNTTATTCSGNPSVGTLPQPIGCAATRGTRTDPNTVFVCALGYNGLIVQIQSDTGQFTTVPTHGSGSGAFALLGQYLYFTQTLPHAGSSTVPGSAGQIGQVVAYDYQNIRVIAEVPIIYPDLTAQISDISIDGLMLTADANLLVLLSTTQTPISQLPIISLGSYPDVLLPLKVGNNIGHREVLSYGERYGVLNNADNTVLWQYLGEIGSQVTAVPQRTSNFFWVYGPQPQVPANCPTTPIWNI